MDNISRFPFQTFEPINSHGYSVDGEFLHVKVVFIRYVNDDSNFDCVIECDGVKSFSHTDNLWRDGETPPPDILNDVMYRPYNADKPVAGGRTPITKEEALTLQKGDELVHLTLNHPTTVVSVKDAPAHLRLRDECDKSYYNVSIESMTNYRWNQSIDRV